MKIKLKCLSLWEPWATLVVKGHKRYETRSWYTYHRGPLAIHASTRMVDAEHFCNATFRQALQEFIWLGDRQAYAPLGAFTCGCIIGVVFLSACDTTDEVRPKITEREIAFGDYSQGRYAWQFTKCHRFDSPVHFRGRQQLFNVEVDGSLLPNWAVPEVTA